MNNTLTDTPASQRQRNAALDHLSDRIRSNNPLTTNDKAVTKRIITRDYGHATPAQALVCLSYFPDNDVNPKEVTDLAVIQTPKTNKTSNDVTANWHRNSTVKECNALIRLVDGDLGKDPDRFFRRVAWLVTADQHDIQGFLRGLNFPAPVAGNVDLPANGKGRHGCRGFLRHDELFPRSVKQPQANQPETIIDLFG